MDGFARYKVVFKGDYFVVSCDVGAGSSGAPVFSEKGEVVGMINAGAPAINMNFGLTVHAIKKALREMELKEELAKMEE